MTKNPTSSTIGGQKLVVINFTTTFLKRETRRQTQKHHIWKLRK